MPHVLIKMLPGRSPSQKRRLAEAVTTAVMQAAECGEDAVSVSIEDIEAANWTPQVYTPEIAGKPNVLFKKPGYKPF